MRTERYVVVDFRKTCGNSVYFYCWDADGYSVDVRAAAIFTEEEARKICEGSEKRAAYRLADVLSIVQHHVDQQDLRTLDTPWPRRRPHVFGHLAVDELSATRRIGPAHGQGSDEGERDEQHHL